jgi:hypothetical protein
VDDLGGARCLVVGGHRRQLEPDRSAPVLTHLVTAIRGCTEYRDASTIGTPLRHPAGRRRGGGESSIQSPARAAVFGREPPETGLPDRPQIMAHAATAALSRTPEAPCPFPAVVAILRNTIQVRRAKPDGKE